MKAATIILGLAVGALALFGWPLLWVDVALCGGLLLGFGLATVGYLYSTGAHRWHLRVSPEGYGNERVEVQARRLWESVRLATVKANDADFDDRLAEAVAQGAHKVAALNAQRGLGR